MTLEQANKLRDLLYEHEALQFVIERDEGKALDIKKSLAISNSRLIEVELELKELGVKFPK